MHESTGIMSRVSSYEDWRAEHYYSFYYKDGIVRDERITLKHHVDFLRAQDGFERALDYGCGPTLHNAIACAPYVGRLDMSDWRQDNLDTIRHWVGGEPGAPLWHHFTRYILECEGGAAAGWADVQRREARTRAVVDRLLLSDARRRFPLGRSRVGAYDLLVSGYCLDCISGEPRVWRQAMRNVLAALRPGGALLLNALWRCASYQVADRWFPGANIDVDDLYGCLQENGFPARTIEVLAFEYPDQNECGYPGILIAFGRRQGRLARRATTAAEATVPA